MPSDVEQELEMSGIPEEDTVRLVKEGNAAARQADGPSDPFCKYKSARG